MKEASKIIIAALLLFLLNGCKRESAYTYENPPFNTFNKLKITAIHPEGWIKEFLERQKTGLTGNIEAAGYPFNTCLWACEKMKGSTKEWWPYEQTSYYIDGVHRLGLLLNDDGLIQKAKVQTSYVMEHIDKTTGRISTRLADRWWRWPYANFLRNYMVDYSLTEDEAIIKALQKHYLTFTASDFADDLELANVEELCWLYGITKDEKLIELAEKAYQLFKSTIEFRNRDGKDIQFGADRIPDHHAVVYLELVKIPAILYSYTGKKNYLKEALNGIQKMEKFHMLVSGLPSSTEHFSGQSELSGTETCNAAVFPYTYGYFLRITGDAKLGDKIEKAVFNGGIGAVAKDFKSHQYFSAPNQFIATSKSNPYGHHPARMAFLPGHDVECCTGNVNRFMPYYVEEMWLSAPNNGLAAALYGPSSVEAKVGENKVSVRITEKTKYPFSETIEFRMQLDEAVRFPFYIRIPKWSKSPEILVNGKVLPDKITSGEFYKLERIFTNGDVITLKVPMKVASHIFASNGIAIERGPLTFSLPIDAEKNIFKDYKKSTKEFPGWELRPKSEWNYALSLSNGDIEVIYEEKTGYPWDVGNSPVKIKVPARKVSNWTLEEKFDEQWQMDVVRTPAFSKQPLTSRHVDYIELVPYGSTMLRLTVFPEDKQ